MKNTYTKTELQDQAPKHFKNHPTAKRMFATTDGQFFLEENRANLHAGPEGKVYPIDNENYKPVKVEKTVVKGNDTLKKVLSEKAEDLIAAAASIETVEDVQKAIETENARKKARTTVLEAYEQRIVELTKAD